jgi:hypothetical protein
MIFEEQSFINSVLFHEEELRGIMRGDLPKEYFSGCRLRVLSKRGVFERRSEEGEKCSRLVVSPKAREVLDQN